MLFDHKASVLTLYIHSKPKNIPRTVMKKTLGCWVVLADCVRLLAARLGLMVMNVGLIFTYVAITHNRTRWAPSSIRRCVYRQSNDYLTQAIQLNTVSCCKSLRSSDDAWVGARVEGTEQREGRIKYTTMTICRSVSLIHPSVLESKRLHPTGITKKCDGPLTI